MFSFKQYFIRNGFGVFRKHCGIVVGLYKPLLSTVSNQRGGEYRDPEWAAQPQRDLQQHHKTANIIIIILMPLCGKTNNKVYANATYLDVSTRV